MVIVTFNSQAEGLFTGIDKIGTFYELIFVLQLTLPMYVLHFYPVDSQMSEVLLSIGYGSCPNLLQYQCFKV